VTSPAKNDVRGFGLVMLAASLVVAWRLRHEGVVAFGTCIAVGVVLAAASFFAPAVVRPLADGWAKLGRLLGRVTTPILLVLVFGLVVIPLRVVLAVLRIDPLAMRFDRSPKSHFVERSKRVFDKDDFERLS